MIFVAAVISGMLNFTLPRFEAADSCGVAQATCTDLDSVFLDRQDPYTFRSPTTIKRNGVRGMEGAPWSFSYSCDTPPCQYDAWTKDIHGNPSCISAIVQIGGTTSVPPLTISPTTPEFWVDVAGRRVGSRPPRRQGVYISSWGRKVIQLY